MTQKWKTDPTLHSCDRNELGEKIMDYESVYVDEFLNSDPLRDWESIDRCVDLFFWCVEKIEDEEIYKFLDCGSKDGQFPEFLESLGFDALGIEISQPYVDYAREKNRPVEKGNVCDLDFEDRAFDFVFSHHLLGLTPDYYRAMMEMYRVSSKYMVTLNDVPGNKRKHYSYIDSPAIYDRFIEEFQPEVLFNGYWKDNSEWVLFIRRNNNE